MKEQRLCLPSQCDRKFREREERGGRREREREFESRQKENRQREGRKEK
jgi:hypothetical protein